MAISPHCKLYLLVVVLGPLPQVSSYPSLSLKLVTRLENSVQLREACIVAYSVHYFSLFSYRVDSSSTEVYSRQ